MKRTSLGKRIRNERLLMGMTQEQLAEAVDVSATYIGYIERGERSATIEKLILIANTLHVTIDYLLQDSIPLKNLATDKQLYQLWSQSNARQKALIINIVKYVLAETDT